MRYRQLNEIDGLALDVGQLGLVFQDDAVIAVGIVADDQRGRVDAAAGRDGQASMLVMEQPSYSPAVYWLMDST